MKSDPLRRHYRLLELELEFSKMNDVDSNKTVADNDSRQQLKKLKSTAGSQDTTQNSQPPSKDIGTMHYDCKDKENGLVY